MKPGDQLHSFVIKEVLGHGGMGGVFVGENIETHEFVAIKTLFQEFSKDEAYVRRFQREASVYRKLNHPNIVRCVASGFDKGIYFIAMEHIKGKSLDAILKDNGKLGVEHALKIMDALAGAVYHAHSRGVIHRDIKPQNIMVNEEGIVKLLDFGVAQADDDLVKTASGSILGTFFYSSPEQNQGQKIDERSDLYSLGLVSYEMLTGQRALHGSTLLEVSSLQVRGRIKPPASIVPEIPARVDKMVMKLLERDPNLRFQSARDLQVELRKCLDDSSESTAAPSAAAAERELTAKWSQAREAFTRRDLDKALELAIEVSRVNTDSAEVHCLLGKIYAAKEYTYNAIEAFKKTMALDPGNCQYKLDFAFALYSMKMIDRAKEEFRKVLEIDPQNPFARQYLQLIEETDGSESVARMVDSVDHESTRELKAAIISPPTPPPPQPAETEAFHAPPPPVSSGFKKSDVSKAGAVSNGQGQDSFFIPPPSRMTQRHSEPGQAIVGNSTSATSSIPSIAPSAAFTPTSSPPPDVSPPMPPVSSPSPPVPPPVPPPASSSLPLFSPASPPSPVIAASNTPPVPPSPPPDVMPAANHSGKLEAGLIPPPGALSPAAGEIPPPGAVSPPGVAAPAQFIPPPTPDNATSFKTPSISPPVASYVPPPRRPVVADEAPGTSVRDNVLGRSQQPPGFKMERPFAGTASQPAEDDGEGKGKRFKSKIRHRGDNSSDQLKPPLNPRKAKFISYIWWGGGHLYNGLVTKAFVVTVIQLILLSVIVGTVFNFYPDITIDLKEVAIALDSFDDSFEWWDDYVVASVQELSEGEINQWLKTHSKKHLKDFVLALSSFIYLVYFLKVPSEVHQYAVLSNLTGKVLEVRRDLSIKINLGEERGVQVGQIFLVQKRKHIDQVHALNFKTMMITPKLFNVGEAKVVSTTLHFAICKFRRLPGETSNPSVGDRVTLRKSS